MNRRSALDISLIAALGLGRVAEQCRSPAETACLF